MDFTLWDNNPDYINYYSLMNEKKHEVISKKVMLISIELGKFLKTLEELETDLDRWLYCFKHLPELEKQPKEMQGEIFNILYRTTALYNLTDKNMKAYNKSVTEYADVRFAMACSREEGYEKGIERGIERGIEKGIEKGIESQNLQITKNLIKRGLSLELISDVTGLTPEQIRRIR
jgi:predicted transposase/invertase (TIGR01784 family)